MLDSNAPCPADRIAAGDFLAYHGTLEDLEEEIPTARRMARLMGDQVAAAGWPESARTALVSGEWDFLSQLLANGDAISETAAAIPYINGFGNE